MSVHCLTATTKCRLIVNPILSLQGLGSFETSALPQRIVEQLLQSAERPHFLLREGRVDCQRSMSQQIFESSLI